MVEIALNRVSADARSSVTEIILLSKSTPAQKRALLLKKGLPRTVVDDLEILSEVGQWFLLFEFVKPPHSCQRRGGH